MRDTIFILAVLAVTPMIFSRPYIGVLLWGWTALLTPNFLLYGFAAEIRYNLIFAILTILSWFFSKEKMKIPVDSTTILLILFALLGTLSALFSFSDEATNSQLWDRFIKIMVFAIIVTGLINSRLRIHSLLLIFVTSIGFYGVSEGAKFLFTAGSHHARGAGSSIISDNNHFALAMIMLLPIIGYLIKYSDSILVRRALKVVFFITFLSVLSTYSRGGFIGLAAIGFWVLAKSRHRLKIIALGLPIILAVAIFLVPESWYSRINTIETASQDDSFMGRVIAWKISTLIALDNPILGGGFHAVQDFLVWKNYSQDFNKLDFIPTPPPDPLFSHAAHSIYFEILGDMGFSGLILFLLLLRTTWKKTNKITVLCKESLEYQWAYDMALFLQMSLLAYMVAGAALSLAYFDLPFAIFAIVSILFRIVEQEKSKIIGNEKAFSQINP